MATYFVTFRGGEVRSHVTCPADEEEERKVRASLDRRGLTYDRYTEEQYRTRYGGLMHTLRDDMEREANRR